MKNKTQIIFNKVYFFLMTLLLTIEIYIGMYVKDSFVRPYLGGFLVVILIYCFLKAFWKISYFKAAIYVLLFSFVIEFLQYFNIVEILGLQENKLASIIIGTSFSLEDLLAYFLGVVSILIIEYSFNKK